MVNNAAWLAVWQSLSISGVTPLAEPPTTLDRVKLPAGWPQAVSAQLGQVLVSCLDANVRRSIVYDIAVGAVGQKTGALNYAETAALLDATEAALKALSRGNVVNFLDFQLILTDKIIVAGIPYWGLEIRATGRNV